MEESARVPEPNARPQRSVFYTGYPGAEGFRDVFEGDLTRWLADSSRPWVSESSGAARVPAKTLSSPNEYYENIERDFGRLDIAGIDNDRAFEIPLSDIYVRLRVMFEGRMPQTS